MTAILETGREHELKCWPAPFVAIARGEKGWEFRYDDRGYAVGDILILREWEPGRGYFTGRILRVQVVYILHGGFGLPAGYVIMSIVPKPEAVPAVTSSGVDLVLTVMLSAAAASAVLGWLWSLR